MSVVFGFSLSLSLSFSVTLYFAAGGTSVVNGKLVELDRTTNVQGDLKSLVTENQQREQYFVV